MSGANRREMTRGSRMILTLALNFDFDADLAPNPAFDFDAVPDPAFQSLVSERICKTR
jgi:hypothetical protein